MDRAAWARPVAVARLPAGVAAARSRSGGWLPSSASRWPRPARRSAGLPPGSIRLKWPNDLVIEDAGEGMVRKLAGVLGETDGLGTGDPRAIVGIGVNADWAKDDVPDRPRGRDDVAARARGTADRSTRALLDAFVTRSSRGSRRCGRVGSMPRRGPARQVDDRAGRSSSIAPDGAGRTVRAARCRPRHRRAARGGCGRHRAGGGAVVVGRDPARPPRHRVPPPRPGCNAMARPALRKWRGRRRPVARVSPTSTATGRWWKRRGPTRRGSTRCIGSTWPRCTTSRSTSSATITRRRTPRSGRSCRRWPALRRFEERARPEDGRERLDVPGLAVPHRPQRRRRAPPAATPTAGGAARRRRSTRRPGRCRARPCVDRESAAAALARRRPPSRRPAPGGGPALRARDDRRPRSPTILDRSEGAVRVLIHRGLRDVARDLGSRRERERR